MVTPKNWLEKPLGEIFSYMNGCSIEHMFSHYGKYNVISIGNYTTDGKYLDNGIKIDKRYYNEISKYIPNTGDLTMILNDKTSTDEIIGRVIICLSTTWKGRSHERAGARH